MRMDRLFGDLGFKIHFAAYVAVNLLLIAINLLTTPNLLWFYWPLLGWGIGIIAHGAAIYYTSGGRRSPLSRLSRSSPRQAPGP
jgi:2TM domain